MDNTNDKRIKYPNVREPNILSSATNNLLLGSSIVKRMSRDIFPEDLNTSSFPSFPTEYIRSKMKEHTDRIVEVFSGD